MTDVASLVPASMGASSYSSISSTYPITNAYTDSTSTTYAYITCRTGSNAETYVFLKFADLNLPEGAIVDSVTCKAKGRVSSTSYITTRNILLYYGNNGTAKGSATTMSTSTTEYTLTTGTWTLEELLDCYIRFYGKRGTSNTSRGAYLYVYGATLSVVYTYNDVKYTVTTTITNGTLIPPTTAVAEVSENNTYEIKFRGDDGTRSSSMTVNGVTVMPQSKTPSSTFSYEVTTNYETYQTYSLSNATDGNTSSYWWSAEPQATGKYVLVTFSTPVTLKTFQTYSSNSSDMPRDCNELQVSSDGNTWETIGTFQNIATCSFNVNKDNIKYARIMGVSTIDYWMIINEITITAEVDTTPYYSYTIPAVTEDTTVIIIFTKLGGTGIYIKQNGSWTQASAAYIKTNGTWTLCTKDLLSAYSKFIKKQ